MKWTNLVQHLWYHCVRVYKVIFHYAIKGFGKVNKGAQSPNFTIYGFTNHIIKLNRAVSTLRSLILCCFKYQTVLLLTTDSKSSEILGNILIGLKLVTEVLSSLLQIWITIAFFDDSEKQPRCNDNFIRYARGSAKQTFSF